VLVKGSPCVTVLMTVYNGMPYLGEAVQSVLNQSFCDFEFLIVDDASTDNSVSYIHSLRDPRIRLVCNEHNKGQVPSLNKGLALAQGRYVARLDQDDICLPRRLEKQVAYLNREIRVAAVGSLMIGVDAQGRSPRLMGRDLKSYGTFVGSLLLGICPVAHPSVVFRRDVVTDLGGYDESFAPAEDVELWTRFAKKRHSVSVISEPLIFYRIHEGQQSLTKRMLQKENIRRSQEKMIQEYCPEGMCRGVLQILSMDGAFWKERGSKEQLVAIFRAWSQTRARIESTLEMSIQEKVDLTRVINRWLGVGVSLSTRIAHWPSFLWYPAVWLFSPLLLPRVRPALARLAQPFRWLRASLRAKKCHQPSA
jgi:GT2 family glycosyltransferase